MTWQIYADQARSEERSRAQREADASTLGVAVFRIVGFPRQDAGPHTLEIVERDHSLALGEGLPAPDEEETETPDDPIVQVSCSVEGSGPEARLVFAEGDEPLGGRRGAESDPPFTLVFRLPDGSELAWNLTMPAAAIADEGDAQLELGVKAPGQSWSDASAMVNVPVILATTPYGGQELRRGDNGAHVSELQRDLYTLGYTFVRPNRTAEFSASGEFDRHTEWAVREFQIYAQMEHTAREAEGESGEYLDRLSQVDVEPEHRYGPGLPISGVVNRRTATLIKRWVAQRWRCPVVIQARVRGGSELIADRISHHTDYRNTGRASTWRPAYVRDFTGHYTLPEGRDADGRYTLGAYQPRRGYGGPVALGGHTWGHDSEMTPERLTGQSYEALSDRAKSTFRVIRAVSEQECGGQFDSLNAWDNAFLSAGYCHWTLTIINSSRISGTGQLGGFLSYFAHAFPDAYEQAFGFCGVWPSVEWEERRGSHRAVYVVGNRVFSGGYELETEDGSRASLPNVVAEYQWFRSWPWFYRFAMAGRCIEGWQRAQWNAARMYVRAVLTAPRITHAGETYTIGDIFTSERAVAMLLRWQVRGGAELVNPRLRGRRNAAQKLFDQAKRGSGLEWPGGDAPRQPASDGGWTDAHEARLVEVLYAEAGRRVFHPAVAYFQNWSSQRARRRYAWDPEGLQLGIERHSFDWLDDPAHPPSDPLPAVLFEEDEPSDDASAPRASTPTPRRAPASPRARRADSGRESMEEAARELQHVHVIGDSQAEGLRFAAWRAIYRPHRDPSGNRIAVHPPKRSADVLSIADRRGWNTRLFVTRWERFAPPPSKRLVLLEMGGNDLRFQGRTAEGTQGYIRQVVENVRSVCGTEVRVVVATVPARGRWFDAQEADLGIALEDRWREVNEWIQGGGADLEFEAFDVNTFIADGRLQVENYRLPVPARPRNQLHLVHLHPRGYSEVWRQFREQFADVSPSD